MRPLVFGWLRGVVLLSSRVFVPWAVEGFCDTISGEKIYC